MICAGGCGRNLCAHCDAQNQVYDDALQARIRVERAERDAAEAEAAEAAATAEAERLREEQGRLRKEQELTKASAGARGRWGAGANLGGTWGAVGLFVGVLLLSPR